MYTLTPHKSISLLINKLTPNQFPQILKLKRIILPNLQIKLIISIRQDINTSKDTIKEELCLYSDYILSHECELLVTDNCLCP